MKHPTTLVATLIALALALSWSHASAQTVTLAMGAQPETLDPHKTAATSSFRVTKSIYDGLVEPDREGEIVGGLAEAWDISEDGLTWTFTLREGVSFHDGSLLGSEDVVATLNRVMAEETASPRAGEFEAIASVEAAGPHTVVLELSEPSPALLATLASGWGAILPADKVAAGHDFANDPVGTGPFRFDTWVRDSFVRFNRFDDYYRGASELDTVTIRFIEDSAVQLQGLIAGELDIIDTVSPADFDRIRQEGELELVQEPSGTVLVASLNQRRPHLDDPRVRRALNYAIDKEVVLEVAYGGGELIGTYMEAGSPWYPDDVEPFSYDPERARALLDEAGVEEGWTVDLALPAAFETHVEAGQIIQSMLRDVGVDADIRMVEWGVWLSDVYGGDRDFDMTVIGHTGRLDPVGRLGSFDAAERNYVGFEDAQATEMLRVAARSPDWDERRQLYADVLRHMHDEPPFVYLGTALFTYAHHQSVDGFWITPLLDTFDFRDVTVAD